MTLSSSYTDQFLCITYGREEYVEEIHSARLQDPQLSNTKVVQGVSIWQVYWKVAHEVEVDPFCDLVKLVWKIVSVVCVVRAAITVQLVPLSTICDSYLFT